jgi:hypothetical protein
MNRRIEQAIHCTAVLVLGLVVGTVAWCVGARPARADALQGFSLGGGVGRYNITLNNAEEFGSIVDHYSTTDTAFQVFAQWRFAPFLALEGQYMNLGTNRRSLGPVEELSTHISGWAPWLVATLPLGSPHGGVVGPFELFVKAGEFWYQYHADYTTPAGTYYSSSDTYNHFVYGGGLGLVFVQRLDVRLEYDELHIQETNNSHALWLTAAFNF